VTSSQTAFALGVEVLLFKLLGMYRIMFVVVDVKERISLGIIMLSLKFTQTGMHGADGR